MRFYRKEGTLNAVAHQAEDDDDQKYGGQNENEGRPPEGGALDDGVEVGGQAGAESGKRSVVNL